jgi:hypothetical protein
MIISNDDLIIIDDFYLEPDKVRNLALSTEYQRFGDKANFPGAESVRPFFTSNHIKRFEEIIGSNIKINPERLVFGKFRYCLKNDKAPTKIHFDKVSWAAIVYLSLNEHCKGGLGIYKHKKTGLEKVPSTEEQLKRLGCKNIIEFDQKYVYPYSKQEEYWELIEEIPIKYNRLILFKGSKYFHGITQQFGDSIYNSRLSQVFFFNT